MGCSSHCTLKEKDGNMKVGSKVVCIRTDWCRVYGNDGAMLPAKGEIYTINKIAEEPETFSSGIGLGFVELGLGRWGYDSSGFRPVDELFGEQVAEKLEVFFVPLEAAYKEQQHENKI